MLHFIVNINTFESCRKTQSQREYKVIECFLRVCSGYHSNEQSMPVIQAGVLELSSREVVTNMSCSSTFLQLNPGQNINTTLIMERGRSAAECRTRNRMGSNPLCYRFKVWAFSFSPRCLSPLSWIKCVPGYKHRWKYEWIVFAHNEEPCKIRHQWQHLTHKLCVCFEIN